MRRGDGLETPETGRVVFPDHVKAALFDAQRGRCCYCGGAQQIRYMEIDHKKPVVRGGRSEMANLQLLCVACNMRKGIQTDKEFRRRYRRLMPKDGSVPMRPIAQVEFSEEILRVPASRAVRRLHRRRIDRNQRGWRLSLMTVVAVLAVLAVVLIAAARFGLPAPF